MTDTDQIQVDFESEYAHKPIVKDFIDRIILEFDGALGNWALGFFSRLDQYLNIRTYESKNKRKDELIAYFAERGADQTAAFVLFSIIHGGKQKQISLQRSIGLLASKLPHEDKWENVRTASELIALGSSPQHGLYNIARDENQKPVIKVNFWKFIETHFGKFISKLKNAISNPPLLVRPKVVTDNSNCGYHTFREPLLLGTFTNHDFNLDYATINQLNSIEWTFNPEIMAMPEKPSKSLDTEEKKEQFAQLCAESQKLYSIIGSARFYLTWRYDSRGRVYSNGYGVNLQSYEYKKALLDFAKKEYLT